MLYRLFVFMLLIAVSTAHAQEKYVPTAENLESREWFQDARFGLFIHWGVYSVLGDGEWVQNNQSIDKETYKKLPAFFNPVSYNPAEWVALAKSAGMKYITITSKHHDGFAMFDSKLTEWDIVDRTPYKKDIIRMLAEECRKEGIKLFFYHSQLDWYHDDYFPRGNTGRTTGRPEKGNWYEYLDFMDGQLQELLTSYGDIGGIWFDGMWDKRGGDWRIEKTYNMIHSLQPACLIGSNHHLAPFPGEDFQMFEKDLPGQKTETFNMEQTLGELPFETCETMNNSWGFNLQDKRYKSTKELIHYLVRAAGYNSNFLLNVGPMPDGRIQPEFITTLKEIGEWMDIYGSTIYGTRGGPVSPKSWGVTTRKDNIVYMHILQPEGNVFIIPDFGKKIRGITSFINSQKIKYKQDAFGITISVPEKIMDGTDTILVIET